MGEPKRSSILRETAYLSIFSVALQGMGLLLNIFLTRRLGAASVGVLTLMGSFYGLAAVLSGGSGFIATSRFLSEELGCGGNPKRVFQFASGFCLTLSSGFAAVLCLFAPRIAALIPQTGANALTIRLLSISLPVSAWTACLKGRCYAYQKAILPAVSECIEFLLRAGVMAFYTVFLIPVGKAAILTAFAVSGLAGQGIAALFLMLIPMPNQENCNVCTFSLSQFLRLLLTIMGNACLVALLSSTNDALVPLTLLQFGDSTDQALAQFGDQVVHGIRLVAAVVAGVGPVEQEARIRHGIHLIRRQAQVKVAGLQPLPGQAEAERRHADLDACLGQLVPDGVGGFHADGVFRLLIDPQAQGQLDLLAL